MFSRSIGKVRKPIRKIGQGIRPVLIDYGDHRETVFLAGTGRSGTTWVANIINYANTYRLLFEPFHLGKVDIISHFRLKQYLRPDNCKRDFIEPAKVILSGNIRNAWVDKFNRKMIARKRLVKDIRANLLLKWIKTNFPEIPIILLLRHPCAVAYSRIELDRGIHFPAAVEEFLVQDELMEDFLDPFRSEIENAQSVFERQVFIWCIENYVPLKQFRTGEIHLAFYENFCTNPEQEIGRLFSFLGTTYSEKVMRAVKKPSAVSRKESAVYAGGSLIESWKKHITDEQVQKAVEILSLFGLQSVYSEDPMPLVSGEQNPFDKLHSKQG
jgi:hypothetical protein